jgi:hypothetical protein
MILDPKVNGSLRVFEGEKHMTNDFDIGKRGITVEMDRPRELCYSLGAMRAMEDLAHRWAKKSELTIPGGAISSAWIMGNLGNDSLFGIALWGALRKESPQMKMEEVDSIYEAYLEKTGDRSELVDILLEAYARAKNPRRLASLTELEALKMEVQEKTKIATGKAKELLEQAKELLGAGEKSTGGA